MDFKPGTRVKNYTLERQLGKGASGEVWKAYDETKTVAIKFMNENLMTSASASKHRERLLREVESLRRLQHPNIPTLYDYDLDFKRPYLAMRYVGGDSYDRLISSGEMLRIPLERRLEMIRDLAFALTAAHEAGIIHRDIKPANMTGIENPYLLDFSISLESDNVEHTQRFVGTTLYMSADGVVDRLSDNYSFAVVVYEMLFGTHPIYRLGDSIFNQFIAEMRIQNRQWTYPSTIPQAQLPADLRQADLRRLDAIFERAIGARETRYQDLRIFVRELRQAIMPHESVVEQVYVPEPPAPQPAASSPPAPPPAEARSQPAQPVEQVSTEKSDFLNKAFLNLPAVKPEQPAPEIELEQTSLEHSTVPYDYEAKRRVPRDETPEPDQQRNASPIRFTQPPSDDERSAEPAPGLAGPDDMTMMEIRIPPQETPAQDEPAPVPPAAFAGPDDRTMMEIKLPAPSPDEPPAAQPVTPPPAPPASVPVSDSDATIMDIPAPRSAAPTPPAPSQSPDATIMDMPAPQVTPPRPAQQENFTLMEMQAPKTPPQRPPTEENFTLLEAQSPKAQPPPQADFTMMEVQGARRSSVNDNFTMMEMQKPVQQSGIPSPMSGDNFTLLEMNSVQSANANQPAKGGSRTLLIVAGVILLILVLAAIVFLATGGAGVV